MDYLNLVIATVFGAGIGSWITSRRILHLLTDFTNQHETLRVSHADECRKLQLEITNLKRKNKRLEKGTRK